MRNTETVAILFADIAKSTPLYELLGDARAQSQITRWLSALEDITERFKGKVIKSIGDEVLCTFPNTHLAVNAGIAMHQVLDLMPVEEIAEAGSPNLYVGIHFGRIIKEGHDIFGDSVNVASRTVALAQQRQILVTEQAALQLGPDAVPHIKMVDTVIMKGKQEKIRIHEYIWEQIDLTMMVNQSTETTASTRRLELVTAHGAVVVDQNHPCATIGRQSHNDVVISNQLVSRSHARVEYRWGRFILTDLSSNGTYLLQDETDPRFIKRDEVTLRGSGQICVGGKKDTLPECSIRFLLTSS